jgi:3-methyladenine DNA glycosylase/8-oxoguanine DNA glycosylase
LRRPDILPVGDYGVQAAIKKHYKKRKWPKPAVNGEDRKTVGPLSLDRLLVSVEDSGYEDG